MARKKKPTAVPPWPQIKGEIWEVGRRRVDVTIADIEATGAHAELLLAVQSGEGRLIVLGEAADSSLPLDVLSDFVLRAMSQPLIGDPRRPEVIRVGSQAEADILAQTLAAHRIKLEVAPQLAELDTAYEYAERALGSGMRGDYRTQAARAGESLSEEGLRQLYRTAKEFYQQELWLDFDEEEIFEIEFQPAAGRPKTVYGIVMGIMGEAEGLALYGSLDDLKRVYEFSQRQVDQPADLFPEFDAEPPDEEALQRQAALMQELLSVPSVSLTYTPRAQMPPELVQEAKKLRLPLPASSLFPFFMKTGGGFLELAQPAELRHLFMAMRATLDWDRRISEMDIDDEIGVTITTSIPPVAGFLPEAAVRTTLVENPLLGPEDEF